jgi:uncharacterized delta-60 repeat protein
MNRTAIFLFTAAAVLLYACASETEAPAEPAPDAGAEPEPEQDAAVEPEPEPMMEPEEASFELSLAGTKLPVLQGASASVEITVTRRNGFAEAIAITAGGLPDGVSARALIIEADEDGATLELRAEAEAPHSLPTEVTVLGTAGEIEAEELLTVTVYGPPGSLDTSFAGGKAVMPAGASDDYAHAVAVQADGKIVVAGGSAENLGDFAVVRLERDGDLDPSFGDGGLVTTSLPGVSSEVAYAVAVQSGGEIVVAGAATSTATGRDFALVRYTEDGELDETFGDGGVVVTSFTNDSDTAYALVLQDDGKIVVGGSANLGTSATGVDFALARYNQDGSLDESFGTGGKLTTSLVANGGGDTIYALALAEVEGETRIVAAGGEGDFLLARYRADGALDTSFGDAGKVVGLFGSSIGAARAVQHDADGRVLVAGHSHHDFALARLTAMGAPDASFGEQGLVLTAVSTDNWDEARGLAVEESGAIVVGGFVYEGNTSAGDFALVRYDDSGALDAAFGEAGVVITAGSAPNRRDEGSAVLLQNDERVPAVRIVVAGSAGSASNSDFAVTRYWR